MAKVSFNGVNREIVVLPGVEEVSAQIDLYSEWKNWVQTSDQDGSNSRYPAAFRTFGGDPTITGQFAPRYFFLINNWELLASSVSIQVATNLYNDGDGSGIIIDNAAVLVRNSDAPIVDNGIDESLDYMGVININTRLVDTGNVWPYGTNAQPVTNLQDAIILANRYGISTFKVKGNLTFDENMLNSTFIGDESNPTITFTNNDVSNSRFEYFSLTGQINIDANESVRIENCDIIDLNGFNGIISNSIMSGDLGLSANHQPKFLVLANSVSGLAGLSHSTINIPYGTYSSTQSGTASIVDMTSNINIRNYSGGIGLGGTFATGSFATIEIDPGSAHIESDVTGGTIVIRGVGQFNNETVGNTFNGIINTSGLYYDIENTTQVNSYRGVIIIDTLDGASGSVYPSGTNASPVDNLEDALILSDLYNIDIFEVYHGLTISSDISGKSFNSPGFPPSLYLDNVTASNSTFRNVIIQGTMSATSQLDQVIIYDSIVYDLDNFYGVLDHCGLGGTISFGINSIASFNDSRSYIPGTNSPAVCKYLGHTSSVSFNNRAYSGGLLIKDWNNPSDVSTLEYIAGKANIDPSCTEGLIVVRGVGTMNNLTGTASNLTLITDGFTSDLHDSLERVEPEVFRIGDVVDNLTGSTSSEVYDLLQSVAGTVSLIYNDTTNILSDTTDILVDVDTIITKIDAQSILLNQIAGLTQKNYRIFNQVYDINGCLTESTIKTYPTALDATNNTNEDYTYEMTASYDVDSRLIDYKVIEL
tara:strand:- start:46881 stop:49163 length:2283 start_codon:yes stop_codon:yes gene_type:complete